MTTRPWIALVCGLTVAMGSAAGEFTLTPEEERLVSERRVVLRANLDASQRRGTVHAAVRIEAPPDVVFRMMINCEDALEYVPHLRKCQVRDRAADDSWLLVEHVIDFGWYAPKVNWVSRAELAPPQRIAFRQVRGDFKAYEGAWELEPVADGAATLLRYRAYIDPPGFVPSWFARSTFRRDMPQLMTQLRGLCEAEQSRHAGVATPAQ